MNKKSFLNKTKLQNSTFDEALKFRMFDHSFLHVNLQRQQDGVHEFVFLVQTTCSIFENFKG